MQRTPTTLRVLLAAAVSLSLVAGAMPARAAVRDPRLRFVRDWSFGIGERAMAGTSEQVIQRFSRFDLVVLDGEEARAHDVRALKARGVVVLGYMSVGTIESWR